MASFVNISKRKRIETERNSLIKKLQDALAHIKTLQGLIPICAICKNIRDDAGLWHQMEIYIEEHTNAFFSHSMCPDCMKKSYPELFKK